MGSDSSKLDRMLASLTSGGERILASMARAGWSIFKIVPAVLLVYVVIMAIFAYHNFDATKAALLSRGISDATASLIAWAVMLGGIGVPGLAILRLFFSRGRPYHYVVAMVPPVISWGIAQIPANFDTVTQRPLKFCSSRPDGTTFCLDHAGFDPLTQQRLVAINAQLADIEYRKDRGLLPKRIVQPMADIVFFDPLTGKPKVWVSKSDQGCYDMFDNAGVNPQTGEELQPVNTDIVRSIKECPSKAIAESARLAAQAKEIQEKQDAEQIEARRLADLKSMINCTARATTAIGIKPATDATDARASAETAEQLARSAKGSLVSIAANFFRPQFFSEGYFERAYSGDVKPLQDAGAFTCVGSIWLGELESSCGEVVSGVATCDLRLTYRVVDRTGSTLDSGSVSATGPGVDRRDALQNGTKRLIESNSSQFFQSIRGG